MIIIDTNVVSELIKDEPHSGVLAWVNDQNASDVYITAITSAELLFGIARLPSGRRKDALTAAIADILDSFGENILPFDAGAAVAFAELSARRMLFGRAMPVLDAQIAATAISVGAEQFATRNTRDFENTGVSLLNPWL
ncbi:type II toxin-antitoxin system VapC family toxin [Subtercola lobariae]|uniref:Ribonuclease VapC n=1 Tax=Subtercola lobariae TaxID=1588641 RepID=A0A917BAD7_9MICO|nr:type II toxin-antitoxin system VapC family toxin [Subtercola lobariae]GGF32730.1 ribonuclease VapC [Subtercola lobariae]